MNISTPLVDYCTNHPLSVAPLASRERCFPIRSVRTLAAAAGFCLALAGPAQAALVGHWTFNDSANPWAETSGYQPAGTHDGVPIGTAGATAWSAEGHAGGRTAGSLDLTAGGCGLRILNTSQTLDAAYQPTFDDGLENGMTHRVLGEGLSRHLGALGFKERRVRWLPGAARRLGEFRHLHSAGHVGRRRPVEHAASR